MSLRAHDAEILWNRDLAPGAITYDLQQLVPEGYPTLPTSCAIVAGNAAGHWSADGFALSNAATPTFEVYDLSIQFSRVGESDLIVHLTIIAPQIVRYVEGVGGSDAADGLSPATAWVTVPGKLGAPVTWKPGSPALCVLKGGTVHRVGQVSNLDKVHYASGHMFGWGDAPAEVTSFEQMSAPSPVSVLEVGGNANWPSIVKYARPLPDSAVALRSGGWDAELSLPAQWPSRGADRLVDSQNPRLQQTGGMRRIPYSNLTVTTREVPNSSGSTTTWYDVVLHDPQMDAAPNAGLNFTGYETTTWCGANHVHSWEILLHDPVAHTITYTSDLAPQVDQHGFTAYNIQGHPGLIRGANDFAWSVDKQTIYGWWTGAPEIATEQFVFKVSTSIAGTGGPNVAYTGGAYGLRISGFYTSALNAYGGGYGGNSFVATTCTHKVLYNEFRHGSSRRDQAAAVRLQKSGGGIDGWLVEGNVIAGMFRTSGIRFSAPNVGTRIRKNALDRIGFTSLYAASSVDLLMELNTVTNSRSTHGNAISLYTSCLRPIIRYNDVRNSTRPLVHHAIQDGLIYGNLFETDESMQAVSRWNTLSTNLNWERCLFTFPPGAVLDGSDAVMFGGAGTVKNCAMMGFTLSTPGPVMTDSFSGYDSGNEGDFLVAPHSGNSRGNLGIWDGVNLRPQEKAAIGPGWFGVGGLIADVSVIDFSEQFGVPVSGEVIFKSELTTDAAQVDGTVSGAGEPQVRVTADEAGSVVISDWSDGFVGAVSGNWIWVRHSSSAVNQTETTSTLDLGAGNVFAATSRTVAATGWPNQMFDGTQDWRTGVIALAGEDSQFMVGGFAGRFDNIDGVTTGTFAGTGTGNAYWQVEVLTTGTAPNRQIAFRIKGRDSNNSNVCYFSTPNFTLGEEFRIMWSVDLTKATGGEGIKIRYNGDMVPATVLGWVQGGVISWSGSNHFRYGNAKLVGVSGCFLIENSWVDISDDDVWGRFTALRMGRSDGSSIFGRKPLHLLVGSTGDWNHADGLNRGRAGLVAGGKFKRNAGNFVVGAPSSVNAWPSYAYATSLAIVGPAKVYAGQPMDFVVVPNGALADPIVVALGDGGQGGSWTPLTIDAAIEPSGAASYSPAGMGYRSLTANAIGVEGGSLTVEAIGAVATGYVVELARGGQVGVPAAFTVTLNGSNPDGVAIDPGLSGSSGLIAPDWVFDPGVTQISGQFTPTEVGIATFAPISTLADPSPFTYATRPSSTGGVEGAPGLGLGLALGL